MDNSKNRIRVNIAGTRFTVVSSESEEYTGKVAQRLNDEIAAIRKAAPGLSLASAVMLAGLNVADAATKAQAEADALREQVREYLSEAERYRSMYEQTAAEAEKLRSDIEVYRKRLGEKGKSVIEPAPVSRSVRTVRKTAANDEAAEEITDFFDSFETKKPSDGIG